MTLIPRKRMSSDLLDPEPREGSYNGVTSDGVFKGTGKAIDNMLDDGSASEAIVVAVPSSQSGDYVVGNYYEVQGKVAKLRTKTEGDNVTHLTFDSTSGILEAINSNSGKIAVFECTYSQEAQGYVYPAYGELNTARLAGKLPVIVQISPVGGRTYYVATQMSSYQNRVKFHFVDSETGAMLKLEGPTSNPMWSTGDSYDGQLDANSTNAVQNKTLYAVIGNVETLLAAL